MGAGYSEPIALKTKWFNDEVAAVPDLSGKVIAITGTTSGTGRMVAEVCAKKGAKVLLLNRKSSRSDKALAELQEAAPDASFVAVECDLQSFASVRSAAQSILSSEEKLNVLSLNAGVMALEDKATEDGYDVQMQTNVISHFLLAKELLPLLAKAEAADGQARIVQHSSVARFGKALEAKYLGKNGGNLGGNTKGMFMGGAKWTRYQQTKLGNMVSTYALADAIAPTHPNILCLVAHPGVAATSLQVTTAKDGGMPGGFMTNLLMKQGQSAEDGACGLLHAMVSDADDIVQKGFYGPGSGQAALKGPAKSLGIMKSADTDKQKKLFMDAMAEIFGEFTV